MIIRDLSLSNIGELKNERTIEEQGSDQRR